MTKHLLILLFVVSISFKSKAQVDTSFWFVAPDISSTMGDFPIVFHFQTYSQPSIIQISQPAFLNSSAISATLNVPANSTYTFDVTSYIAVLESGPANSVTPYGVYISSKENISVYYSIGAAANKEMISLKGRRALGKDFYAAIPTSTSVLTYTVSDGGVGFDVVATQTGVTTLLITPKAAIIGHAKNSTFVKTLNRGETFSVKDNNTANPSQLAGSIISADKEVAVTIKGSITGPNVCPSYFTDQLTSSEHLGKDHVIMRGNGAVDVAYIMAPLNATGFTISTSSGSTQWLINATESYSVNITNAITYIKSDKPVYILHLSGYGCKLSGAQLAPVYCAGSYSAAFTRISPDSLNLNICTRAGNQGNFTLLSNGVSLPIVTSGFTTVPGSNGDLVAGRLYFPTSSIPVGSYNELINSTDIFGLSAVNGGYSTGSTYAQSSDFEISSFAIANVAPTATICGNTQFTLNGVVGGGPNTGVWSILQGYGALSGANTVLSNNIYVPSLLDTTNNALTIPASQRYVKIILNTTGICPTASDTLRLHVNQPPIVTAGASSIVCANNPTLQFNGNVYGASHQGIWSVLAPGSGTFLSGINTFTPKYQLSLADTALSQLVFVLTSTNNAGCNPVTGSVSITVSKPPLVDASTLPNIVKCSNNATINLNGTVSGTTTTTGIWQTQGTGVFLPNNVALSTNYIPSLNDVTQGNVWLYLESTNNGLCFPTRDSVNVLFTEPSYANAGADANACENDPRGVISGLISGTVTTTGVWSGGGGTFSPSTSALTATYTGTPSEVLAGYTTLTLTTSNNGLCLGTTDVVRVNFQLKPYANFSVTSVCLNQLTDFTDQSLAISNAVLKSRVWDFGDNSPLTTSQNASHIYSNPGTYTAQLVVKNIYNCLDTIVKPVVIYELPNVDFSITRACSGSAQLIGFKDQSTIVAPSTIPASGHTWDFGGFGYSNSKDTSIVFPSEGLYSITKIITSDRGCQSAISKTVNVTPRPVAKFVHINNSIPGLGANVSFRDTSSYAQSWTWDFGNGETSTIKNPSTFYKENGLYVVSLTVTDQFGCPNSYTTEVRVSTIVADILKLIPNVVTPNDDGKNDYWRLDFIDVYFPQAEIEIYNRWGVRIFRSIGYSNAWDGSYKGDPLPVGGYFYTINLHDKDATPVIKGTLTLIK